jgi:CRISPR/Cas system-associated protein Cas7 (RAMP superfamily)
VCHIELARVGVNDVNGKQVVDSESRANRQKAAVQALLATLLQPAGAQTNTQKPHILHCSGILTASDSFMPAPLLSPLAADYREEMAGIALTLNKLAPASFRAWPFEGMAEGVALLERVSAGI